MRWEPPKIHIGPMFDREPPQSRATEICLLASVYFSPAGLADACRIVTAADFFFDDTRRVFVAICELYRTHKEIDFTLVQERLVTMPDYDATAADRLLDEISSQVSSAVGCDAYAKVVRNKSKMRELIGLCGTAMHTAYTKQDDLDGAIASAFEGMARLARNGTENKTVSLREAYKLILADLELGKPQTIRTGLAEFDYMAGGIPRSGLWTIFGCPGSGKSTFALEVANRLANGWVESEGRAAQEPMIVRYYSVEQIPQRAGATIYSQTEGVEMHAMINTGIASEKEKNDLAYQTLVATENLHFYNVSMDPNQLYAECASLATKHPHGVLFVDYLQELPAFGQFIDLTPRIAESMRILARISRELGWLVVVVCQMDKAAGKLHKTPKMSDGLGSSAIEQRSDFITYVYRPHQQETIPPRVEDSYGMDNGAYEGWNARQYRTRIGIVKNKYGRMGAHEMQFVPERMTFISPQNHITKHWPEIED